MNKKADLQIPFSWMFAIIVGAIILVLAIYFLVHFMKTGQTEHEVKTSKEIGVLLSPLEIGFEEGKKSVLEVSTDTKIYSSCNLFGNFGRQGIMVKEKLNNKWAESSKEVVFQNKYIFAEKQVEGRKFYLFSKPFNFPFKVASLIYLIPVRQNYCFVDAPEDIENEIKNLGFENMFFKDSSSQNCSGNELNVCFSFDNECNISIDCSDTECLSGRTIKQDKEAYFYTSSLMYATIFSDLDLYECQLKRLLKRTSILASLYGEKLTLTNFLGCLNYLSSDLNAFKMLATTYAENTATFSGGLTAIASASEELYYKNKYSSCRLW